MSLLADAIDTESAFAERLHKPDSRFALGLLPKVEVVVYELRVGVGLVGELERLCREFFAQRFVPGRLPPVAVVFEGFVDHVPSLHASAVTAHDGLDVRPHSRKKQLRIEGRATRTFENPTGCLLMPDQHVADYEQTVPGSEGDVSVRSRELEAIGFRVDCVPLQRVFRTDRAEVAPDDFERSRILAGDLSVAERGADEEAVFQNLPEGGLCHAQLLHGHSGRPDRLAALS